VSAPPRFIDSSCPFDIEWGPGPSLSLAQWCTWPAAWSVDLTLPFNQQGAATYALPSSDVRIDANVESSTEYFGTGQLPPTNLKVTGGKLDVISHSSSSGEANVDIVLETAAGDEISANGHVTYGDCTPETVTICED
jgi:hypothetical protein